jgi:hypothetical protein
MKEDAFEWDDDKVPLTGGRMASPSRQAVKAFRDPFRVEWIGERENYGEERINLLGMCNGVILHVTYTDQGMHRPDADKPAEPVAEHKDRPEHMAKGASRRPF